MNVLMFEFGRAVLNYSCFWLFKVLIVKGVEPTQCSHVMFRCEGLQVSSESLLITPEGSDVVC